MPLVCLQWVWLHSVLHHWQMNHPLGIPPCLRELLRVGYYHWQMNHPLGIPPCLRESQKAVGFLKRGPPGWLEWLQEVWLVLADCP